MLWRIPVYVTAYMVAFALWKYGPYVDEESGDQPKFDIHDYQDEDNLLDILYSFDLKFQSWFDQTVVRHQITPVKNEQFNIRWSVIEHDEKEKKIMDDRRHFTISNFNFDLETENRTEAQIWHGAVQYLKFLASQRARDLNLYVGYLSGDTSILMQSLMSDPAYEKYIKKKLAMIEQEVTEVAKRLSFNMNMTTRISQKWNELISHHTPLMNPECFDRYNPVAFYQELFNATHVFWCSNCVVQLNPETTLVEFAVMMASVTVIGILLELLAHYYRVNNDPCEMDDDYDVSENFDSGDEAALLKKANDWLDKSVQSVKI
ncbi:hypothetical protein QR680_014757 [Steinernema hermaphroditum]|uniref:Uncharacterized protein n=1 Tax=Steinernema hermaphroditum TaxID=289476 RepID=A0AA39M4T8_9BILA|nr:hypothetical protein QR680_014757 [Steinernema hermaphroditum]